MLKAFIDYWYLTLILIGTIILTIYVCVRAGRAASKRNAERNKILEKLKYEKEVKEEFAALSASEAMRHDPKRLVDGAALSVQQALEKLPDMLPAFSALSEPVKQIYALYYVIDDSAEGLSKFFEANGKPLTPFALSAVEQLAGGEAAEIFAAEYGAFDSENEEVSFIPAEIKELDKRFNLIREETDFYGKAARLVADNFDDFK